MKHKTLEEFVDHTRAYGKYSFSWEDIKHAFDISDKALNQSLFRLKKKNKIAKVRKGFYAIITPEYSNYGMLPPHLFIDDLMKSLDKKYYVALFSAAALHGAAHQQPMEYYVVTEKPSLRDIKTDKLAINFFVKQAWPASDIVELKTDAGYIQVSSPEITALDLLTYGRFGINRVFTILQELSEVIRSSTLSKVVKNYTQTSSIQRLGFLIQKEINNQQLAEAIKKGLGKTKLFPVPLLKTGSPKGEIDPDWKVIKNVVIEGDL